MSYKVQLEKQVYIAGQTISGKIVCNFAKNKTVNNWNHVIASGLPWVDEDPRTQTARNIPGIFYFNSNWNILKDIKMRVIGEERVKWQDEIQIGMTSVESCPVTSNVFLKTDMVVYTGGDIPEGRHEYQFGIKLPEVLPSTYKNEFGSIRYFLFGIVSEAQRNYKTKVKFTLINIIDLNTLPSDIFEPTSYYSERKLSFFCFSGGILSLEIFLDKKAFTTGEVATVKVKLKNTSNARSKSVKLELVERVTACVPETSPRSKIHRKVLSRAGCLINFPRGENVFNLPLLIPENFTILKFDGSKLWNVEYYVVATCVLSSWHTDLVVMSEVIIGHIEAYRRPQNPPRLSVRESAPPPYSTLPRNQQHRIMIAESNV